jgi:hypothetical protein
MVTVPGQLSVAVAVPAPGKDDGLHPRLVPTGQEVNTGGVLSKTVIVVQQTTSPSSHLMVSQSWNEPQALPALTETGETVEEPLNEAPLVLLVIDQECVGLAHPLITVSE